MALGFNHAKTNDEKLAPRRPFVGLRADKWQVIVSILIQNGAAKSRSKASGGDIADHSPP
jgi:hypothetical protein